MNTIEKSAATINLYLNNHLPHNGLLNKAVRYSALGGGKRIRPVICITAFRATGGRGRTILPVASAIELVHTFSLIHDDLPCMDNDDIRRGRPSCHRAFSEDIALLAGDALLSTAFAWIATASRIPASRKITVIQELSSTIGPSGLIGGQALDLRLHPAPTPDPDPSPTPLPLGKTPSLKMLRSIYIKKTALLISSSARIGAILAGATKNKLRAITNYGNNLGLAFQIIDDILDTNQDKGISYPHLAGRQKAEKEAKKLIDQSIVSLKPLEPTATLLKQISLKVFSQI